MTDQEHANGNGHEKPTVQELQVNPFERFLNLKRVRLIDVDVPTGQEVELPSGKVVTIQLFQTPQYQLWLDIQKTGEGLEREHDLLTYAIGTDDVLEIGMMSPVMRKYCIHAAARQGELMLALLRKNVPRPELQKSALAKKSPRQPSPPKTKSSTSSSGSRKRSPAKTSGP